MALVKENKQHKNLVVRLDENEIIKIISNKDGIIILNKKGKLYIYKV